MTAISRKKIHRSGIRVQDKPVQSFAAGASLFAGSADCLLADLTYPAVTACDLLIEQVVVALLHRLPVYGNVLPQAVDLRCQRRCQQPVAEEGAAGDPVGVAVAGRPCLDQFLGDFADDVLLRPWWSIRQRRAAGSRRCRGWFEQLAQFIDALPRSPIWSRRRACPGSWLSSPAVDLDAALARDVDHVEGKLW